MVPSKRNTMFPVETNYYPILKKLRKGFKLVIVMICVAGFIYQFWKFLQIYLEYPVYVNIEFINKESIELFSVTFCSKKVKRSAFCQRFPNRCHKPYSAEKFCKKFPLACPDPKTIRSKHLLIPQKMSINGKNQQIYQELGHSPQLMLNSCWYLSPEGPKKCRPEIISLPDLYGSEEYLCHIINNNLAHRDRQPHLSLLKSNSPSFEMALDFEPEEQFNPAEEISGIFLIHSPFLLIHPAYGTKTVTPGKLYTAKIAMTEKNFLPAPYSSNCTDYLKIRKQKDILFLDWENCVFNWTLMTMKEQCGCIAKKYFFPHTENFCSNDKCWRHLNYKKFPPEMCTRACHSMTIDVKWDESDLQDSVHLTKMKPFYPGRNTSFIKERISYLTVYVANQEVLVYNYLPKYEGIEIFSYFGGYLGMWLGISLIQLYQFVSSTRKWMKYVTGSIKKTRETTVVPFIKNENRHWYSRKNR